MSSRGCATRTDPASHDESHRVSLDYASPTFRDLVGTAFRATALELRRSQSDNKPVTKFYGQVRHVERFTPIQPFILTMGNGVSTAD